FSGSFFESPWPDPGRPSPGRRTCRRCTPAVDRTISRHTATGSWPASVGRATPKCSRSPHAPATLRRKHAWRTCQRQPWSSWAKRTPTSWTHDQKPTGLHALCMPRWSWCRKPGTTLSRSDRTSRLQQLCASWRRSTGMPRAGLTQDRVVDEAQRIADDVGLSRLTLAALADRLGVRQPSLYKHVDGIDHLQRRIAVRAKTELAAVVARAAVGRARDDAIVSISKAYRKWALDHRGRYAAAQRAPVPEDVDGQAASQAVVNVCA